MTNTPQLDLFGEPIEEKAQMMCCPHCEGRGRIPVSEATARSEDGPTARLAGGRQTGDSRRFRATSRQAAILRSLAEEPQTAQEVAIAVLGLHAPISALEGARRRVSSLKRIGLIHETGEERVNPGSPTPSLVWAVTDRGRRAIDLLEATGWSHHEES